MASDPAQRGGRALPTVRLTDFDDLLLTRERGRKVGLRLPQKAELRLDLRGVKAVSPSFLDELLRTTSRRGVAVSFTNVPARVKGNLAVLERVHGKKIEQAV
jgi:hypothetical protein